uniref:Protein FAR1-RELATED SEQUENCE n=1 Tax=Lactuca sativa TaxID=4236 RepID=A0A9R1UTB0_LACSA|nr:hypothetical protein LSAT_V11C800418630 [Lactuca sativa]
MSMYHYNTLTSIIGMDSSSLIIENEELYLANSKFESYDELLKSVQNFYYAKGYALSIRDSSKDKYVKLQCGRGGSYRYRLCIYDKRKRNTGSHLIKCPFQIVGKKRIDGSWRNESLPADSRTINNLKANPIGHIIHLFIAHPLSIKLVKIFSTIFVMDCTYKTNKYHMPIHDIIGVSCFNTSFYSRKRMKIKILENCDSSVIVTNKELELMNAIKMIFPNTINLFVYLAYRKEGVANCKKHFEHGDEFNNFMSSWTNNNWAEFELLYQMKKVTLEYIRNTRLSWKEKFVSAWTDNCLHFVSTDGFQEVNEKICLVVTYEFNEIKVKPASERIQVLPKCNVPSFRELLYHLSHFALNEIHMQYEKKKKEKWYNESLHWSFYGDPGFSLCSQDKSIDALRLDLEDNSHNDVTNEFDKLLNELSLKYQIWPLSKKEFATSIITKLLTESDTFF